MVSVPIHLRVDGLILKLSVIVHIAVELYHAQGLAPKLILHCSSFQLIDQYACEGPILYPSCR